MKEFPRTKIEKLSVSRMIIGTNWFLGFSHTSSAKDHYLKTTQTISKIADIMEVFVKAGIDTTMGLMTDDTMPLAIQETEQRTGRKIIRIGTPHLWVENPGPKKARIEKILDQQAAAGISMCMPHQCTTDALVDRCTHTIRDMDKYCKMIRERGMIPGLSSHMPESVIYADESDLDVGSYIQIYNAAGFLMQLEVDWVHRIIQNAQKPVITIKPFAAGRLHPFVGLAFNWNTIRDQDMVAVGTMTPDEAREVIDMSFAMLERRAPEIKLQRTRSKSSVEKRVK